MPRCVDDQRPDIVPISRSLRGDARPGRLQLRLLLEPGGGPLLEAARRATDQSERARLYKEMQEIVQEDAPWAFIANWKQNAVTNDRVAGFALEPSFFLLLDDVTKN
jgi:ABC-type dipeptide transport system, periplasmic component